MEISIWEPEHRKLDFNMGDVTMITKVLRRFKIEPPKKAAILFAVNPAKSPTFVNIALGLKTTMESCSPTPIYPAFLVLDF